MQGLCRLLYPANDRACLITAAGHSGWAPVVGGRRRDKATGEILHTAVVLTSIDAKAEGDVKERCILAICMVHIHFVFRFLLSLLRLQHRPGKCDRSFVNFVVVEAKLVLIIGKPACYCIISYLYLHPPMSFFLLPSELGKHGSA